MVWEINDSNLNGLSDVLKQTLNPDAAQVRSKYVFLVFGQLW